MYWENVEPTCSRNWSMVQRVEAEESVHPSFTVRCSSVLNWGTLQLRLLMGMWPHIVFVNEVLFFTQNHQRKGTEEVKFQKTTQTLHQQTIEDKQLKQVVTIKCNLISSETVELHPLFRASEDHSTLQLKQLFRSVIHSVSSFGKTAELTRNAFLLLSIGRNEENSGY